MNGPPSPAFHTRYSPRFPDRAAPTPRGNPSPDRGRRAHADPSRAPPPPHAGRAARAQGRAQGRRRAERLLPTRGPGRGRGHTAEPGRPRIAARSPGAAPRPPLTSRLLTPGCPRPPAPPSPRLRAASLRGPGSGRGAGGGQRAGSPRLARILLHLDSAAPRCRASGAGPGPAAEVIPGGGRYNSQGELWGRVLVMVWFRQLAEPSLLSLLTNPCFCEVSEGEG